MGHAIASWAGLGTLLFALGLVFSPSLARGQTLPAYPPPPQQQPEPQTGPADQPGGPQGIGGQVQPPTQPAPAETQPPPSVGAKPISPFEGSPLLQMFERQPDASAPPLQLRLAPLPAEPTPFAVQLSLTAEEEYTDNANQTKNNRKSEFSTRLTPGISIRADRPVANASLSYAPSFFIQNNSIGETEFNQNLSLRAALWPTGRFQFNVADDFVDSNDSQDLQDPGAQRTGTNRFLQNQVTAEAAYVLPRLRTGLAFTNIINQEDRGFTDTRISYIVRPNVAYTDPRFNITGAYTLTRGDENSAISIPYWSNQVDGRFGYVFTPTITAGMMGYYQFQEPDVGRHFSLGRGRATGTFVIGPDGTLNLEAGADVFAFQGDSTEVKPSFLFAYTQRFLAFSVSARYEHGYVNRYTDVNNSGVTLTRSAGVFFTSSFFRDLTPTLGVRYEENDYQNTTLQGARAGTVVRTLAFDVLFRYLIVRSLFLNFGYSGTFRISTVQSEEYNENLFRVGLTYQYDLF